MWDVTFGKELKVGISSFFGGCLKMKRMPVTVTPCIVFPGPLEIVGVWLHQHFFGLSIYIYKEENFQQGFLRGMLRPSDQALRLAILKSWPWQGRPSCHLDRLDLQGMFDRQKIMMMRMGMRMMWMMRTRMGMITSRKRKIMMIMIFRMIMMKDYTLRMLVRMISMHTTEGCHWTTTAHLPNVRSVALPQTMGIGRSNAEASFSNTGSHMFSFQPCVWDCLDIYS